MSDEDRDTPPLGFDDIAFVAELLGVAKDLDDADVSFARGRKVAQFLFAQIAAAQMSPHEIPSLMFDEKHPLLARRFPALNPMMTNQSWYQQEERLRSRYEKSKEKLGQAEALAKVAQDSLASAEAEFDEANNEMAKMRVYLLLRSLQEFVRPAIEAGPIATVLLAVCGYSDSGTELSARDRAVVKRTLDVLSRRVEDDDFLAQLGKLVRDFVIAYDDQKGGDGRLSLAEAESARKAIFGNEQEREKLSAAMKGEPAEVTAKPVEDDDDPFAGLPI